VPCKLPAPASSTFFSYVQYAKEATGGQVELAVTLYDSFYEFYKSLSNEATGAQVELAHVYFLVAWQWLTPQKQLKFCYQSLVLLRSKSVPALQYKLI
jgi:hypothetical protein